MSKYRNKSGGYRRPTNERRGPDRSDRTPPVDGNKRTFMIGGLIGLGTAAVTMGTVYAATRLDSDFFDFDGADFTHHMLLLDGTDKSATSAFQADAIVQTFLVSNKAQYSKGDRIDVGRFGQHISSPLELEARFESPGNEETSGGILSTPSELEKAWQVFEPSLRAAVLTAQRSMAQPEATLVFDALDRAVEHARRESGADAKIKVLVATDGLVHNPTNGFSAYVSERNPRFPSMASPLAAQLTSASLEGVSIQIVGIRRDGRKTRSGRDLGAIQRKVVPFLIDHWAGRGADVSATSLTWV